MTQLRNKVTLIGHAGITPEIKSTPSGKKVAKFSLATNENYKNKAGEKSTDTQWHNLVLWGKQATIAEKFIQKGSEIAIEGKLNNRSYINKNGVKKFISEVIVSEIVFMAPAPKAA
jgi:single-strand DNA-binding protein